MKFSITELRELEGALEGHYPPGKREAKATARAVFEVAKLLNRPWADRFKSPQEYASHYAHRREAGDSIQGGQQ